MKAKTIEDLRKEFDFPLKSLKLKEAPFWMLYSQFLEQKLLEPVEQKVSKSAEEYIRSK